MKYKFIIFDVGGTILDTEDAVLRSLRDTLKEFGVVKESEELKFALGITMRSALTELGINDYQSAEKNWDEKMTQYKGELNIFPGIVETLAILKSKGILLGIVTSKSRDEFNYDFKKLGIKDYFQFIVCSDDTLKHKPNPEPMLECLKLANIDPIDALYIGDSKYDQMCASQAGVNFGLAVWGSHLKGHPTTYNFINPKNILELDI